MNEIEQGKISITETTTESSEHGKKYISTPLQRRKGRTRLIRQIIGDVSLQLYFLLPDEDEHLVEIRLSDSQGDLDFLPFYARNQFRYLISQKSPEDTVLLKIYVDGEIAYGRPFYMPLHLREKNKSEGNLSRSFDQISEELIEEHEETADEKTKVASNKNEENFINISEIEINLSEISNHAIKILKGAKQ